MKTIILTIFFLSATCFLIVNLYPYLYNKWIFFTTRKTINKIAKKYDGKTKKDLEKIADLINQASNEEEL